MKRPGEPTVDQLEWYHTMEVAPGVVTPGWFDTRGVAESLPWPDLSGRRCLDVGTFEGFWAFEMERRGATEVVAVDILDPRAWDWPRGSDPKVVEVLEQRKRAGEGFLLAREALGSRVVRHELSVYDLSPEHVGRFDVVYLGSLLLHLRDPVRALERVHDVLVPGGHLLSVDAVDAELSLLHPRRAVASFDGVGRPWWWKVNRVAHRKLVESAGFRVVAQPPSFVMPAGRGQQLPRLALRHLLSAPGREATITRLRRGDPHAAVLAVRP